MPRIQVFLKCLDASSSQVDPPTSASSNSEKFKLDKTEKTSFVKKLGHSMNTVFGKKEGSPSSDIVLQSSSDVGAQSADEILHRNFSNFLKKSSSDPDLLQYFLIALDLIYVGYGHASNVLKRSWGKHIELVFKTANVLKHLTLQESWSSKPKCTRN